MIIPELPGSVDKQTTDGCRPGIFFLWTLLRPEIVRLCLPARANQEVLAPGAAFQPRTYPKVVF